MAGDEAFLTSLAINAVIALVVTLLFSYLRPRHQRIYQPRCLPQLGHAVKEPPRSIGNGFFSWIPIVWGTSDEQFYNQVGLDGLMYTSLFAYGLRTACMCAVFGLLVLVPVYYTARTGDDALIGIDRISLSNVEAQSPRLWATWLSVYVFAFVAMYNLRSVYATYVAYRRRYLSEPHPHFNAVLMRDLPEDVRSDETLLAAMNETYDDVISAVVVKDVKALDKLVEKRQQTCAKLEHVQAAIMLKPEDKRPTMRVGAVGGVCCFGGTVEDAEAHLKELLEEENAAVQDERSAVAENKTGKCAGFVVFKSRASAVACGQVSHAGIPYLWTVQPSPEIRDIKWSNLDMPYLSRSMRSIISSFATGALVLFWSIPVAFVSALTTLEELGKLGAGWLVDIVELSPILQGFLEGFLPTLALIVFMAMLPTILTAFSTAEGIPSIGLINLSMMNKLYVFYLVNVFFVSLLAGAAFDQMKAIIDSPTSIVNLLGEAVPRTGVFFTTYVMLLAFSSFSMSLLRVGPLIVSWLKLKYLAKTTKEQDDAWNPGPFNFGTALPVQLLVALLLLVYASSAPVILPFTVLFFLFGYVATRYTLFYVTVQNFEIGGRFWPAVFDKCMLGVVIYEITMLGILGLKKGVYQVPLLVPLLPFTLVFWSQCNTALKTVVEHQPRTESVNSEVPDLDPEMCVQPSLKAPLQLSPAPFENDRHTQYSFA
eukprot:m.26301 g.26301  ORF g.26301 m.26301 type:complete len:709 (-) comp8172_c0_seq1:47-2173(-)